MKRIGLLLLFLATLSVAMVSGRTALEFSGGFLVTMDDINRTLYISDAGGRIVEQKILTELQHQQLTNSWTMANIQSLGLQTTLAPGTTATFAQIRSGDDGRSIRIPYGVITGMTGEFYRSEEDATSPALPAFTDSIQDVITSVNMTLNGTIEPSGKVFIQTKEIRLKDGFQAKRGSEVRMVSK